MIDFIKELLAGRIRPVENRHYREWVKSLPCCILSCRKMGPSDPHHIVNQFKAKGGKTSDYWTMPLCHDHHQEYTLNRLNAEQTYGEQEYFVALTLLQAIYEGRLEWVR